MSGDVRADARRLLQKHADKADLSLDAPTSLDDIRERLARSTHECRCDDSDHENAVHDLASSDVPVLLAAFVDALIELCDARESYPDVWGFVRNRWPTSTPDMQVMKVAEEAGEANGAAIKLVEGRKTELDVLDELADTILAAIGAIQSRGREARQIVADRWAEVSSR